jgi:hypothetical protein
MTLFILDKLGWQPSMVGEYVKTFKVKKKILDCSSKILKGIHIHFWNKKSW